MLDLCRFLSWFRQDGFVTGESNIMNRGLDSARSNSLNLKTSMDLFLTNMQRLSSQDINWWTEVVWITCGLLWCCDGSAVWTLILTAPIQCRGSIGEQVTKSVPIKKQLIYILDDLRVSNFFFLNNHLRLRFFFVCFFAQMHNDKSLLIIICEFEPVDPNIESDPSGLQNFFKLDFLT